MTMAFCESITNRKTEANPCVPSSEALNRQQLPVREEPPVKLILGEDAGFIEHVAPLVREYNVILDFARVERIDAAGISALLALYRSANDSGHCFSVTNVSERVAQILAVVGLDRYLVSHNAVRSFEFKTHSQRSAA